jgi:hypothetical protein
MDSPAAPSPRSCSNNACDSKQESGAAQEQGRCVNSGATENAPCKDKNRGTARHRQPGFGGTACGSRSTRPTGVR